MPPAKKSPIIVILEGIRGGKLDKHLDLISQTIRERRNTIRDMQAIENSLTLQLGDKVRLLNIRPKYLTHYDAVITGTAQAKGGTPGFIIDLIDAPPVIRRYRTKGITVPANCVEKLA